MNAAELHTHLREVVAIGRRGGYDNDEIADQLARVVRAHSRDAVVTVLNEARAVVERETGDYPEASAAVTSGIFGGFDQWAAGRIEELREASEASRRTEATPLDYIRAHAIALGRDPDSMATAAQAQIDQAQAWQREQRGAVSGECPDGCSCHAYMPPGRVCSWCQQEGHEDQ